MSVRSNIHKPAKKQQYAGKNSRALPRARPRAAIKVASNDSVMKKTANQATPKPHTPEGEDKQQSNAEPDADEEGQWQQCEEQRCFQAHAEIFIGLSWPLLNPLPKCWRTLTHKQIVRVRKGAAILRKMPDDFFVIEKYIAIVATGRQHSPPPKSAGARVISSGQKCTVD